MPPPTFPKPSLEADKVWRRICLSQSLDLMVRHKYQNQWTSLPPPVTISMAPSGVLTVGAHIHNHHKSQDLLP
ncbi:unnamed protein product [Cuscuta campestris]|uniref:Uncharacterized protein n=1 Tax=Cuscuta campestris TaxID=132261 RepID=A0A484NKP5_9ASTE|nr:unnamed protein product [Cuscuta campestris]